MKDKVSNWIVFFLGVIGSPTIVLGSLISIVILNTSGNPDKGWFLLGMLFYTGGAACLSILLNLWMLFVKWDRKLTVFFGGMIVPIIAFIGVVLYMSSI